MEGFASAPEDEGKDSKKKNKKQKQNQVESKLPIPFRIPIFVFLFLVVFLIITIWILSMVKLSPSGHIPIPILVDLKGSRESWSGWLTRMVDWRSVVKMVGRWTHGAGPVRHFLDIVVRGALHVVEWAARWSGRWGLVDARDFGVGLGVHCWEVGRRKGGGKEQRNESLFFSWKEEKRKRKGFIIDFMKITRLWEGRVERVGGSFLGRMQECLYVSLSLSLFCQLTI